ncbi:membrane-bound lytic murein transglycosylase MltF [Arhodomonas aquaeolei]|uniref:membrane-bound lytic murein transglycosylase MltF n=1 Tax=Arhodomonas aquaeolei TaxID=2369 RepID=UPI00037D50E4|nr:membrane-bound lytic murein transglycosylase MltF [Arhodomonas aquaeolei]
MSRLAPHLAIATTLLALLALTGAGGFDGPDRLDQIRDGGVLSVAMRVGPASYAPAAGDEPSGFEYELLKDIASGLDVKLEIQPVTTPAEATALLENGGVDLVAATMSPTQERRRRFIFSDSYLQTQPRVIYRQGAKAPESIDDLSGRHIEAIAHSVHAERLAELAAEHPGIEWKPLANHTAEDLLYRVWRERSDYAVTDKLRLALNRPFYPELRAGMKLGPPRGLAFMMRASDGALRDAINEHLAAVRDAGMLAVLRDEYFGHLSEFDYVGTRTFLRHITKRLPPLRRAFQQAAKKEDLDWRLLAAIGYQESHWNPDAVSPTGVRGVMMLTQDTAQFVGIDNRRDPAQSISGGATYLNSLRGRLPDDIEEPNRTWFTLAAYNVGLGHLEDARRITEMRGGDPDKWLDVRDNLPLLAKKRWYSRVQHGYARGWEPVRYVANIRRYYELLRRVTRLGQPTPPDVTRESMMPAPLHIPAPLESIL